MYASAIQYENLKSNSVTSEFNNAKVFMHECHQTNEKNGDCRNITYFAKKIMIISCLLCTSWL